MKIAITGGSGASGRIIIRALAKAGHTLSNLDRVRCEGLPARFVEVSLTDYSQISRALEGHDAVVHFGSIPYPDNDYASAADTFNNNTTATFNVFNACAAHRIKRVVWASSETVFGYPFQNYVPPSAPVSEDMTAPQNGYAISKLLCEQLANMICGLNPGMTIIGLRLSNILYADELGNESGPVPLNRQRDTYRRLPDYWTDVTSRDFNLWNYIDARDVATAVECALVAGVIGAHCCSIIANDTIMNRPTRELVAERFENMAIDPHMGEFQAMVSNERARHLIGFAPRWSWREIPEIQAIMSGESG